MELGFSKNKFFTYLMCILVLITTIGIGYAGNKDPYKEGVDYERLNFPVATHVKRGNIEVVELFWYGCPHCYHFESNINEWLKHKPKTVEFVRIPDTLDQKWIPAARIYYTLETLGKLDKFHSIFFQGIHDQNRHFNTLNSIAEFFSQYGINKKKFIDAYYSLVVKTKLNHAQDLNQQYNAQGVPTIIVDGKYRITPRMVGGYDKVFNVVDFLVNRDTLNVELESKRH